MSAVEETPDGATARRLGLAKLKSDEPPTTIACEDVPLVHEAGHAAVLETLWRGRYRYSEAEGSWRRWTGRVWGRTAEAVVVAEAQRELRAFYGQQLGRPYQTKAEDARLLALHQACCRHGSVVAGLAFLSGAPSFHTDEDEWDPTPTR